MVRFSCFYSNPSFKSKRAPSKPKSLGSIFRKEQPLDSTKTTPNSAAAKSEEPNADSEIFCETILQQGTSLRKIHSMGSGSNEDLDNDLNVGSLDINEKSASPASEIGITGSPDDSETEVEISQNDFLSHEILTEIPDENESPETEELVEEETNMNLRIMRIADWVNDLPHFDSQDEMPQIQSNSQDGALSFKVDDKVSSMEAYVSSLNPSATTFQLSNHGLTAMPFLSAFSSLKALNLSGNSLAKISLASLPKGLHLLDLSRNKISAIEGLRELTRLRVLNLSFNRLLRIGHGLGSCSSIKELYLAGNKISEVDGLHRLLKLTVLDLRFNKISTSKSLDQLAANYSSLRIICLQGNPVQKNLGEEQLRKYLLGLLPHLVIKHQRKGSRIASTSRASSHRPHLDNRRSRSEGALNSSYANFHGNCFE